MKEIPSWFECGKRVGMRLLSGGIREVELVEYRGAFGPDRHHVVRIAILPDDPEHRYTGEVRTTNLILD